MADGHLGKCKECTKKDALNHRQENLEKIRAYDKIMASKPHRIALQVMNTAIYRAQFPKRARANALVNKATRNGLLKKQPCWVCGEKALAHHPDYDRPLDVVWLCQIHHKQVHTIALNDHHNAFAA
jgi:hypothetical protein